MTLYTLADVLESLADGDNDMHDGLDPVAKQNIAIVDGNRLRITFTPYGDDGTDETRAESFTSGPFRRDESAAAPDPEARAAAVAKVKAKIAELIVEYGKSGFSVEDVAADLVADEVATESLGNGRWYEEILHVLLVDGQHVGVIDEVGLTENQEPPGADRWDVVAVDSKQVTATRWGRAKRPPADS